MDSPYLEFESYLLEPDEIFKAKRPLYGLQKPLRGFGDQWLDWG